MLENVYWACGFILACILIFRFGLPALRRFDAENVARITRQEQEKSDPSAHIRHALETAEEQVEPVAEAYCTLQFPISTGVSPRLKISTKSLR